MGGISEIELHNCTRKLVQRHVMDEAAVFTSVSARFKDREGFNRPWLSRQHYGQGVLQTTLVIGLCYCRWPLQRVHVVCMFSHMCFPVVQTTAQAANRLGCALYIDDPGAESGREYV